MTDPTAADIAALVITATTAPTADADSADAVADLADAAGHTSTVLYNWRRDHPDDVDAPRALNLEMTLDQRAIDLRAQAVRLLGADAADALAQMKAASQRVDDFFATERRIEDRLGIANAVIGLASAALVGDAGGVLTAVVGVHAALKAAQA